MITASWLALYSVAIMAAGPPLLRRLTRRGQLPRFAVAVWITAVASVLFCWPAAATLVAIEFGEHTTVDNHVVATCLQAARDMMAGEAGVVAQGMAWLVLALGVVAPLLIVARVVLLARGMSRRAREHACAVRIVGHSHDDIVVMPSPVAAAYCVTGRPSAIVLTTAALTTLRPDQLNAVVAHERAHLAGRHAALVATLRSLASVMPRMRLFTDAADRVATLLEMRADDVAARRHGRPALLGGLLALCEATPPDTALAATGEDVVERAERLARIGELRQSSARAQALLSAAMMVSVAGPASVAVLVVTGTLLCTS